MTVPPDAAGPDPDSDIDQSKGATPWWQQPRLHPWWTVLAVVIIGLILLLVLWDWNWFKRPIEHQVQARTGRSFTIDGPLDVDLGWTPVISAGNVHFGNAEWARRPEMASADQLELAISLPVLLRGKMRIPRLRLENPRLDLETGPDGRGNWQLRNSGKDDSNIEFRRIWISNGKLAFVDAANQTDITVGIASTAVREAGDAPSVQFDGGGHWKGSDFKIGGTAESPLQLRDTKAPYDIDAHAQAGATRAHARGTLLDPLRMRDFDLQLTLSGKNLDDLYPLIGVALPPTPPYTLDGRLTRDISGATTTWHYDRFTGTVGDSDLAGTAAFTTGAERPLLSAELHSKRLDFDDLAGMIGGAPQTGAGETSNPELMAKAAELKARTRLLPDTPYRLDKLRAMDADVRLKADRINAQSLPLDNMDTHLSLKAGLLVLDPLDFGVADGKIHSTVQMDARESTIRTRAQMRARGLDLPQLLPDVKLARNAIGKVSGHADLSGTGNSIAAMLGSSDGQVDVGMGRGHISNLLMEMAGIDIAEIIKFKLGGDRLIPVRCAFADFKVDHGVMTVESLAFDTTDTILIGEGSIDLKNERLDLVIRPRPKDRSILAFRSPLLVDGSFRNPGVRPDLKSVGLRGAIALALGSIAPPAALLATLELGPGKDAGCGGQYAK